MFEASQYSQTFFIVCMIALAVIIFFCLVVAIVGPRFSDRIVMANMISTKIIAFICLLSVFLREEFYLDVALIYAMLGFVAVVVLSKIITIRHKKQKEIEKSLEVGEKIIVDEPEEEADK